MEREGVVVSTSSSGAAQATVLLLGWEDAKAAPLMACARLYKELGFNVISASAELGEEDRRRAPVILAALMQNQLDSVPIIVHVIGRGGMAIWTRLRATMEAVSETRHVLTKVRALVVDSAPWSGDFWSMLRHRTQHASALRTALVYVFSIAWFLLKEIFGTIPVLRTIFGIRKYRSKTQYLSNKESLTMPCQSLYLYGGEDNLADTAYIRRFIRELNDRTRSPPPSPSNLKTSVTAQDDDDIDYDEADGFAPLPSIERAKESPRPAPAPIARGVIYERCWPNCGEPGPRHASRVCASEYVETLAQFLERCDLVPRLTQPWPRFADSM